MLVNFSNLTPSTQLTSLPTGVMADSWEYEVFESTDQVMRRRLAAQDQVVLRKKHTNEEKVSDVLYSREQSEIKYHDYYEDDCGYIDFYDVFHDRHIYVASKNVGMSN